MPCTLRTPGGDAPGRARTPPLRPPLAIRTAGAEDAAVVRHLSAAALWLATAPGSGRAEESVRAWVDLVLPAGAFADGRTLLATRGDVPVAAMRWEERLPALVAKGVGPLLPTADVVVFLPFASDPDDDVALCALVDAIAAAEGERAVLHAVVPLQWAAFLARPGFVRGRVVRLAAAGRRVDVAHLVREPMVAGEAVP